MKRFSASYAFLTLVALAGCTDGTPGGPGVNVDKSEKAVIGQTDDTFNLSVPMLSSTVQQGGKTEATLGIKRAKNFDQDVTLKFAELPDGVTLDPANPMIKHGDAETKITFSATDAALAGDYKIKVTGHPTKGGDANVEFKLSVADKDSFTLSVPLLSPTIKQGGTQTFSIGIKRQKTFDEDVSLQIGSLPTGVTMEPANPIIKRGETEAKLTLTGANDAALGKFDIKVTGHPKQGVDATNEFKLTVAEK